jgi:hypothetical protein
MALTEQNRNAIAAKKVSGKAHTQQNFATTEEAISSNVTIASSTIFGDNINPTPITAGLTSLFATDGVVEKVRFDLEIIPDTAVGTNQSQGYRLKLPANYTTSGALKAIFTGGTRLHTALGKLQIIPTIYGTLALDGTTQYDPVLYQTNGTTVIPKFDSIDWNLDTYNGVVFVQDPPSGYDISALRPGFLEAYLYVGNYLDAKLSEIALSGSSQPGGPQYSVQFNLNDTLSGKSEYTFIPSANTVTIGNRTGLNGQIGLVVGTGSTLTGARSAAFGEQHSIANTAQDSLAVGFGNNINGSFGVAVNRYTAANGVSSFAGGEGTVTRRVTAAGIASFNFSFNTGSQNINHGAQGNYSAILGGINNNIDGGNEGTVVLGGNSIKVTGTSYSYTTVVNTLAIFGSVTGGTNSDFVLTYNPSNKKVRSRTFGEFSAALSTAKGPTGAIQYNLGSGVFSGDTEFYFNQPVRSLTLGTRSGVHGVRSFTQGNSTEAGGTDSVALNNNTTANGNGAFSSGLNTSAEGNYSHAEGINSFAVGEGSHVEGVGNNAEGLYSHAQNENTHGLGRASHAGGFGDGTRLIIAGGLGSFNHSANNSSQGDSEGALSNYSAILGGINNHISIGNTGATIIGGNQIKLTGATYSHYTAVDNLAIWSVPTFGSTGDTVLVYNQQTKKVRTVPQQFIGSGSTAIIDANNGLTKVNFDIRLGGIVTGNTVVSGNTTSSLTWGYKAGSFRNFNIFANSGITMSSKYVEYNSVVQTGVTGSNNDTYSGYTLFNNRKIRVATHLFQVNTGNSTTFNYYRSGFDNNINTTYDLSIKKEDYAQVAGTPSVNKISKLDLLTDQVIVGRYNNIQNRFAELDLNTTNARLRYSGTTLTVLQLTSLSDGSGGNTGVVQTNNPLLIGNTHVVKVGTGSALINGVDNVVTGTTLHSIFASGEKVRITAIGATALGRGTRATGQYSFAGGYYSVSSANTAKAPLAAGLGSFAFYTTTSGQTDNHGAHASASVILGGQNHHIASGNTNAVIIGGSGIKLTGSTYSGYTAIRGLAIFTTPDVGTTGDTVLVYNTISKKVKQVAQSTIQGSGGGTGNQMYTGATPSNVTVGGLAAGSTLTGNTLSKLLERILIQYLAPVFSTFSITGQATTIEVGTALSGSKTFTWSTTNGTNIATNTIAVRDVTANTLIASGLANDGTEAINIGTITNTSPMTRSWRAEGTQQNNPAGNSTFNSSNFTVTSLYPYFYGKVASGGVAAGLNRPSATAQLVTGGTKVVASSTGTITVSFASTSDDYIWFAIPSLSTSKTVWYIDALNTGSIGGSVSPGGNLFPAESVVSVTTVLWAGVNYKVYISNYQTAVNVAMELRNS